MTTFKEGMLLAGIGRDLCVEQGDALFRITLAMVQGQVPSSAQLPVAAQIMTDCASAAAAAAVHDMPIAEARAAIGVLADCFRDSAMDRLEHLHPQGSKR